MGNLSFLQPVHVYTVLHVVPDILHSLHCYCYMLQVG